MKCGHLSMKDGTNAGFGQSCAVELVKSWPSSLEIAVKQPVASFGSKSQVPIKVVKATVTSGKRINSSSPKIPITVLEKEAGRRIIWNDGITRSDSPVLAS